MLSVSTVTGFFLVSIDVVDNHSARDDAIYCLDGQARGQVGDERSEKCPFAAGGYRKMAKPAYEAKAEERYYGCGNRY
jgi:hypothetical protein